jgi:hypothetical protein
MIYALFDESGDLGFNLNMERTSSIFLVTFLITEDKRSLVSAIKKPFITLIRSGKKRPSGVLHSYYEDKNTRKRVLNLLAEKKIQIATMRLDKRKIFVSENPHQLYTSMVVALINRLYSNGIFPVDDDVCLIASQMHTNKHRNREFLSIIKSETDTPKFSVHIETPFSEKGLQAADFISWALWRKYEMGDKEYSNIIDDKIVGEYEFYQ